MSESIENTPTPEDNETRRGMRINIKKLGAWFVGISTAATGLFAAGAHLASPKNQEWPEFGGDKSITALKFDGRTGKGLFDPSTGPTLRNDPWVNDVPFFGNKLGTVYDQLKVATPSGIVAEEGGTYRAEVTGEETKRTWIGIQAKDLLGILVSLNENGQYSEIIAKITQDHDGIIYVSSDFVESTGTKTPEQIAKESIIYPDKDEK